MRIHLIATGGAIMHNLALALDRNGHDVSGSDDEIYNPARDRLEAAGLLPEEGWNPDRITDDLDLVILGMHAKADNPELLRALELNLKIQSFPEFIREFAANKKRVVIAGSHGKTTTTSMIMHGLRKAGLAFDYLVGAQIEGFDLMVSLSDAPLFIIEGDEYLSSSIDRVPKIHHYQPDLAVVTGIAWDHINVFPTYDDYVGQFRIFLENLEETDTVYWYGNDEDLKKITSHIQAENHPYYAFEGFDDGEVQGVIYDNQKYPLQVFGKHNHENLKAASLVLRDLGLATDKFLQSMDDFYGPAKRSEVIGRYKNGIAFKDFAHAPSKVRATVSSMRDRYSDYTVIGILELHTYSSLNKKFIPQYRDSMNDCDQAFVTYSPKTLEIKKLEPIDAGYLRLEFNHPHLKVFTDTHDLEQALNRIEITGPTILLWMSSGHFGSLDINDISKNLLD